MSSQHQPSNRILPRVPRQQASLLGAETPLALLGGLSAQQFLRDYWHKKPLLIRQAIPNFNAPVSTAELRALAAHPEIESRLIRTQRGRWQMSHGPFNAAQLPSQKQGQWTLLVQGVNLYHAAADKLLQQFRFLPDSRLDDLMISVAGQGGGVGAHFDSYDVFLLQGLGQRQWKISTQKELSLVPNLPVKILKNFCAETCWVLAPGDMLYLPPQVAHEGVALSDECMTYSIGFRAPNYQELGQAFLAYLDDTLDMPGHYADPKRQWQANPAWIDDELLTKTVRQLQKIRWDETVVANFLGEYLSTPKPTTVFSPPRRPLSAARFAQALQQGECRTVELEAKTRMLYRGHEIFINGESFIAKGKIAFLLKNLADFRMVEVDSIALVKKDRDALCNTLYDWYCAGWLQLKR